MELVERILDSVDASGGGWPVLVLVLVIGAIVYLARHMLLRQMEINEDRVRERKIEFEAALDRERNNARNYQETTGMMIEAFNKNSTAMSDFANVLRPMSDTLRRIEGHFEEISQENQRKENRTRDRLRRQMENRKE